MKWNVLYKFDVESTLSQQKIIVRSVSLLPQIKHLVGILLLKTTSFKNKVETISLY